jgi:hypothetical protein
MTPEAPAMTGSISPSASAPASSVPVSVVAALKAKKEYELGGEAQTRANAKGRQDSVQISSEAQALLAAQAPAAEADPLA